MHYICITQSNKNIAMIMKNQQIITQLQDMQQNDARDPKSFLHIKQQLIKMQMEFPANDMKTLLHDMHDELCQTSYDEYKISKANWSHFLLHQFIL